MTALFRGPITGAKFFAIFASFFVVIIAVNLVLAFQAIHTFPGLEVANSYVASQEFDAARAAQEELQWTAVATVEDGELVLRMTNAEGAPVRPETVTGLFGRPTNVQSDQIPVFTYDGSAYRAPITAGPGNWNLMLEATAADGTMFRQRLVVLAE